MKISLTFAIIKFSIRILTHDANIVNIDINISNIQINIEKENLINKYLKKNISNLKKIKFNIFE